MIAQTVDTWRTLKRGDMVRMSDDAIGAQDKAIARIHADRLAVMIGFTNPHLYAEISFYGDAKELTYIVHPESLELVHRSDKS